MPSASALATRLSRAVRLASTPGLSMSAPMRENPCGVAPPPAGSPKRTTSPEVGRARPQTIFIVVDLPEPFLPTKP